MKKVGICYFRSLYSQSACSLSVGKLSDYLLKKGYKTNLFLLKNDDHIQLIDKYNDILDNDIIIYKVNYKDFEYGIRVFNNLLKKSGKIFYLVGPFASLNKDRILKKYSFVDGIIDIQNNDEVDSYFPNLGEEIIKDTIICGVDREIEMMEKGHYINLEASTGCIYNCAFCHIKLMNYSKSEKDIDLVVKEMEELNKKLGKKYFIFNDSVFWKSPKDNNRVKRFISLIREKRLNIYFMVYLSLTIKISDELLEELSKVGLIRVFFGVENISNSFSVQNNKYVSSDDTKMFISKLDNLNISYHIGFMLFNKETKYEELRENIDFLYEIKKLFRPGMLVEKMRVLPNSKSSKDLFFDDSMIDQAYNYRITDERVNKYYELLNNFFSNINIRNFEQFFSGIKIGLTIIKRENLIDKYNQFEKDYYKTLDFVNSKLHKILINQLELLSVNNNEIKELKDIYEIAENNYVKFMSFLKTNNRDIYETIPHGTEDLNVW